MRNEWDRLAYQTVYNSQSKSTHKVYYTLIESRLISSNQIWTQYLDLYHLTLIGLTFLWENKWLCKNWQPSTLRI